MENSSNKKSIQFLDHLETMLKANMVPLIRTHEEERLINLIRDLFPKFKALERVLIWSTSDGLLDYTDYLVKNKASNYGKTKKVMINQTIEEPYTQKEIIKTTSITTFEQFVNYARTEIDNTLFLVKDIHHVIERRKSNYLEKIRKLRDLIHSMRTESSWLCLLSPDNDIPNDLEKEIQIIEMPLPDAIEIAELLSIAIKGFSELGKKIKLDVSPALNEKIVLNLLGLTEVEISQVLSFTCVKNSGLGESALVDIKKMKRAIIEKGGYLEFIETPEKVEIGGHERLFDYISARGLYLQKNFREYFNLTPPKGMLFVGPPGCGKSQAAKVVASKWQLPLIRIDMGAIYGEKLGQSESRLRDALRIAEANAPSILWLDEIEKAIGGLNSNDSGTTMRIFGKLLTWMAERDEMVYLYCTANNIDALPPELTRAGRLDAIWWGDLPLKSDCLQIIKIHCKLNKINLAEEEYIKLAAVAFEHQMTGAEIEQSIIESLYKVAYDSFLKQELLQPNVNIIENCMRSIRPYAIRKEEQLLKNRIEALDKFEFTSTAAKIRVEYLVENNRAKRLELE